jgi:hypothetical protein
MQPLRYGRVLIIEGDNIGDTGKIEKRKPKEKVVVIKLDDSEIRLELPDSTVCRIVDNK